MRRVEIVEGGFLDMISEIKTSWAVDDDCKVRESEDDDSVSMEGDMIVDNSSVVSDNSSICGDDLLDFENGTFGFFEFEKRNENVEIFPKDSALRPPAKENSVTSEELENGSDELTSPSLKNKGASSQLVRSVFEMDCVPLWGFTSFCGRRPEMEDALAAIPQFLKVPIDMLIGDQAMDGMNNCLSHLTTHFFGVYDGHGGCQVANYCRDRMHVALTEELEIMTGDKTVGNSSSNCLERWRKVFTNCFIKVDNEISGKTGGHEPVAPETAGDRYLKPSIIPDPEVMFIPRAKEDECLILASDGLWDVMSNEEACDLARRRILIWHKKNRPVISTDRGGEIDPAAEYLANRALQKGSKDNITVIVIDLKCQRKVYKQLNRRRNKVYKQSELLSTLSFCDQY